MRPCLFASVMCIVAVTLSAQSVPTLHPLNLTSCRARIAHDYSLAGQKSALDVQTEQSLADEVAAINRCVYNFHDVLTRAELYHAFRVAVIMDSTAAERSSELHLAAASDSDERFDNIVHAQLTDYNQLVDKYNALVQDYSRLWRDFVIVQGLAVRYTPPPAILSCTTSTIGTFTYTDCY